jgi:hypothetical protein
MVDILHRVGIKASLGEVTRWVGTKIGFEGNPSPDDVKISNWH